MVVLKKVAAFTLLESLVAGLMISGLSGIAMVIYLNVTASLTSTRDILIETRSRIQMDSLVQVQGSFDLIYRFSPDLKVVFQKRAFGSDPSLFYVSFELLDTLGHTKIDLKKLQYE